MKALKQSESFMTNSNSDPNTYGTARTSVDTASFLEQPQGYLILPATTFESDLRQEKATLMQRLNFSIGALDFSVIRGNSLEERKNCPSNSDSAPRKHIRTGHHSSDTCCSHWRD